MANTFESRQTDINDLIRNQTDEYSVTNEHEAKILDALNVAISDNQSHAISLGRKVYDIDYRYNIEVKPLLDIATFTLRSSDTSLYANKFGYVGGVVGIRLNIGSTPVTIDIVKINVTTGSQSLIKTVSLIDKLSVVSFDNVVTLAENEGIGIKGKVTFKFDTNTNGAYDFSSGSPVFTKNLTLGYSLITSKTIVEEKADKIKVTRLTVPNASDYAIRTLHNSITDNSYYNRYEIFVPNGTYWEMDIVPKEYVDVIGQSRAGVIIRCDYNSTKLTPSDAMDRHQRVSVGGKAINSLNHDNNINALHILFLEGACNCEWKNLTLEVVDMKYCVHWDYAGRFDMRFTNVLFNAYGCRAIGIGARGVEGYPQKMLVDGCILNNFVGPNYPINNYNIGYHNRSNTNKNDKESPVLEVSNSQFNVGMCAISEMGGATDNIVKFENCKTTSTDYAYSFDAVTGYYTNSGGELETDPLKLPYAIQITMIRCTYPSDKVRITNRPKATIITI